MRAVSRRIPVVLFIHPFEVILGLILILNGTLGLLLGVLSPSIAALPRISELFYLLVSTVGGVGLLAGLCWPGREDPRRSITRPISKGTAIERASLILVAASYLGLALQIVEVNGQRGAGTGTAFALLGVACILRVIGIRLVTLGVLRSIREQQQNPSLNPELEDRA